MTEVFLVGVSHHTAPLTLREELSRATEAATNHLESFLRGPVSECVLLSTCNRVEVYGAAPNPAEAVSHVRSLLASQVSDEGLAAALYHHIGADAAHHAFRVAASLDSMVVGEPQILGQVKTAFQQAEAAGAVGTVLSRCFHQAFAAAKRARTDTGIAKGSVSVSSIAVDLAEKIFGALDGRAALLVGAGEMGEAAAKSLGSKGAKLTVVNRSLARAERLVETVGGKPAPFEQLFSELVQADVVVTSTAHPTFVLQADQLRDVTRRRKGRPLFLIDIAVPRDIDPQCGSLPNVYLYDVDDLQQVAQENIRIRKREAELAEELVLREASAFERWRRSLRLQPTIVALRSHFREHAAAELARTLPKLESLTEADRKTLERMTDTMINKLLHQPMRELKGSTQHEADTRLIDAARRLFGLEETGQSEAPPERQTQEAAEIATETAAEPGSAAIPALGIAEAGRRRG